MIRLKNSRHIEKIRESGRILARTFDHLLPLVRPGTTTREIDRAAHDFIVSSGAKPAFLGYLDYPASVCASVNHVVIHGIPDDTKLADGDVLSLDLGVVLDNFYSDAARTIPVGVPSAEARRLLDVTSECLDLALQAVHPGNRIRDISRAVFEHASASGFGVVHQFCGHGVGFSLHEDPQVPNYLGSGPNPRLRPGMVIAIEPMINLGSADVEILDDDWTVVTIDGSLSAHFEHTVAVTDRGYDILTLG
jgi:methionyl aminopeptidase